MLDTEELSVLALDRFYLLSDGSRVRLRLARGSDRAGVRDLFERAGVGEGLEAGRLLRLDPRRCVVICATALIDSRETILGIGATEIARDLQPPSVLVVDERFPAVRGLLIEVLASRAGVLRQIHAA